MPLPSGKTPIDIACTVVLVFLPFRCRLLSLLKFRHHVFGWGLNGYHYYYWYLQMRAGGYTCVSVRVRVCLC